MEERIMEQFFAEVYPYLKTIRNAVENYNISGLVSATFDADGYINLSCYADKFNYCEFGEEKNNVDR